MGASRFLAQIGVAVVGAYAALALAALFGQRALMYPAPRVAREPRMAQARLLRIPADDGSEVVALYAAGAPSAPTVAFFHGNGEQLADVVPLAEALRERGLGVLAIEYPGYGLAADLETTERRIYSDADRALRFARDRLGIAAEQTVLCGHSLGTGVATEMATRGLGARLALLSPMTSMLDMARSLTPFLPARLLVRDRYDSLEKAPRVRVPTLVVHGSQDRLIPPRMGRRLAQALPRARFEVIEGAGHNDLFLLGGARLLDMLADFARQG